MDSLPVLLSLFFSLLKSEVYCNISEKGSKLRLNQSPPEMKAVSNLLNQITAEPLEGKTVTVAVEEGAATDEFFKGLDSSFYLLQLPKEAPKNILERYNITERPPDSDLSGGRTYNFSLQPSVLVIIMLSDDPDWWPLWMPPEEWMPEAIILIVSSEACSKDLYIVSPLLESPSSLAILCPYKTPRRSEAEVSFKVWSSMPFASQEQLAVSLGSWDPTSFKSYDRFFIDRFKDMSQKNLTVICLAQDRPLIYYIDGVLSGINYHILDALSWWLHFDLNYITEGYVDWTVIFNEVKRGKSDVFINYATITPQRNEEFDLTVTYYREGFGIILEVPPPLPRWQNVIFPFTWKVWISIVITVICTATTYHILNRKNEASFVTNTIVVMQSLLSEPIGTVPKRWRLRNFLVVWWLVSWFINMSYMSNLIAVLTAPAFPEKLQTAQDLANSDYRLCMVDYGEFVDEALAESTDPVMSALNDILDMVPSYVDWEHIGEEQCIEKVLAGTHAHTETYSYNEILYNILGHGPKIYSFKEQLYPGYLSLVLRKNTPWKYKLDIGMQRLIDAGIVKKWYEDCMADFRGYFQEDRRPELHPLTLSHLQGAFLIFAFGNALGSIFILWEICFPPSRH